jgi:flagellar basal-body rod modification protein FlgD
VSETNVQNAVQSANNALQRSYSQHAPKSNKLGKDEFMKLLMAQVTHQDPLNPMDSKGMMDQLTGMGSLEQLVNLNEAVGKLNETQQDVVRANTFSFLDKDVTVRGGGVPVNSGQAPGLQYSLPRDAEAVTVSILDGQGAPVRQLELGPQGPGSHAVAWDGQDAQGKTVPDGFYHYTVAAQAKDQATIPADLYVRGKVSGVRFENGRPKLTINGEDVDVRDVIEMSNRSQRLYGDQLPAGLRHELRTAAPVTRRRS